MLERSHHTSKIYFDINPLTLHSMWLVTYHQLLADGGVLVQHKQDCTEVLNTLRTQQPNTQISVYTHFSLRCACCYSLKVLMALLLVLAIRLAFSFYCDTHTCTHYWQYAVAIVHIFRKLCLFLISKRLYLKQKKNEKKTR